MYTYLSIAVEPEVLRDNQMPNIILELALRVRCGPAESHSVSHWKPTDTGDIARGNGSLYIDLEQGYGI